MRTMKLGGERIGTGNKMNVALKAYERSTHDKSYLWRSSAAAGTLIPFIVEPTLPGDTFDIDIKMDIKTHPTIGPLFGRFKAMADIYWTPLRLYHAALLTNKPGIGMDIAQIKLPYIELVANKITLSDINNGKLDLDNCQINPSCVLAYQGIRGVGNSQVAPPTLIGRKFNGIPLLNLWDIYYNYHANKQEGIGAVIHTPGASLVDHVVHTTGGIEITDNVGATIPVPMYPSTGGGAGAYANSRITVTMQSSGQTQPLDQVLLWDGTMNIPLSEIGPVLQKTATAYTIQYDWARWGNRTFVNWAYINPLSLPAKPIEVRTFSLDDIATMRELILQQPIATALDVFGTGLEPYTLVANISSDNLASMSCSQEGLPVKTYNSDQFNNWLREDWYDAIGTIARVDTSAGYFTMDQLVIAKKLWEQMNRIMISDGTYDQWQIATYDHEPFAKVTTPILVGVIMEDVAFQEVVSNAQAEATDSGAQPLGTLAGKGVMTGNGKGGHIRVKSDEMGIIQGLFSLTPLIDYSQGNEWHTHIMTMADWHTPAMDEIGFQDLILEKAAWWTTYWDAGTSTWKTVAGGRQTAWIDYQTTVNRVYGNFAIQTNEGYMVLRRKYVGAANGTQIDLDDFTTYIDPAKHNDIYAQTSLDSQNYWVQIAVNMTVRRKMSASQIPNL